MKIINLSDVVSITISTPSEAEFFTSLDNLENAKRPVFIPSTFMGPFTILNGTVTKDNEIKGVVYPIINFKLKDGSNAILKLDLRDALDIKALAAFQLRYGSEVKAPKNSKAIKVDPTRLSDWKNTISDMLSQFLSDSAIFESTFVRVY